jgi:hypothetical protein
MRFLGHEVETFQLEFLGQNPSVTFADNWFNFKVIKN